MTVKQLIEQLINFPQDLEVYFEDIDEEVWTINGQVSQQIVGYNAEGECYSYENNEDEEIINKNEEKAVVLKSC